MSVYPLYFENILVDEVQVSKIGLYYGILCQFKSEHKGLFILWAQCGENKVRIGICIPDQPGYKLSAKVPAKRFQGEISQFFLEVQTEAVGSFFPVETDTVASYLPYLKKCVFHIHNGIPGVTVNMNDCHLSKED